MAEKIINSRIIHKHETEENWLKATNFIPKQGEVVVYDIDSNYSYERFKIGDGVTVVSDLPFVFDNVTADDFGIYVQDAEPADAVDGDIWVDTASDPSVVGLVLPKVTAADNGKVLMVVNGTWQAVTLNMSIDANGVLSV